MVSLSYRRAQRRGVHPLGGAAAARANGPIIVPVNPPARAVLRIVPSMLDFDPTQDLAKLPQN